MQFKKKFIVLTFSFLLCPLRVFAAEESSIAPTEELQKNTDIETEKGQIGDNLFYEYDVVTDTLYIKGTGLTYHYTDYAELPWALHFGEIRKTVMDSGAKMRLWMINPETARKCNRLGELERLFSEADKKFPEENAD